jgi:histidinol-phosphatase (PHP family)
MGAELGEATISPERADILLENAPKLDFIIGSVHTASKKFDYFDLYYMEKRDMDYYRAIMDDYLDETIKLLQYGKFHVLGHLTLPLRYIKNNTGLSLTYDDQTDRLEEIFSLMVDRGIGLELNTNRGADPLPSAKLLQLYRRMGGEVVTIGSDAHVPQHIGLAVDRCQQLLRDTGWLYFATYSEGNPIFHRL